MAYQFILRNVKALTYPIPGTSLLKNTYIDYTIRATSSRPDAVKQGVWITSDNPTDNVNGYSKPLKLYNSFTGRFLGSTEQVQQITGTQKNGEIAGTVNFTAPDNALSFVFKFVSANVYKIYLSEDADPAKNKRLLLTDINNAARCVITEEDPIATAKLDNTWKFD